jgi:hypothetical protein
VSDDDRATFHRIIEPRHDHPIKALVNALDLGQIVPVFEIQRVIENNQVAATTGQRAIRGYRIDAAALRRLKVIGPSVIVSQTRAEDLLEPRRA